MIGVRKGRHPRPETRRKLSKALRGYQHTSEAKRNMSLAQNKRRMRMRTSSN
jgi:hypothetical protein